MLYENVLAQTISEINGSTKINGEGTRPPIYHLSDNVISVTVGLVCINL